MRQSYKAFKTTIRQSDKIEDDYQTKWKGFLKKTIKLRQSFEDNCCMGQSDKALKTTIRQSEKAFLNYQTKWQSFEDNCCMKQSDKALKTTIRQSDKALKKISDKVTKL